MMILPEGGVRCAVLCLLPNYRRYISWGLIIHGLSPTTVDYLAKNKIMARGHC